jgi:hypothetical protein
MLIANYLLARARPQAWAFGSSPGEAVGAATG